MQLEKHKEKTEAIQAIERSKRLCVGFIPVLPDATVLQTDKSLLQSLRSLRSLYSLWFKTQKRSEAADKLINRENLPGFSGQWPLVCEEAAVSSASNLFGHLSLLATAAAFWLLFPPSLLFWCSLDWRTKSSWRPRYLLATWRGQWPLARPEDYVFVFVGLL